VANINHKRFGTAQVLLTGITGWHQSIGHHRLCVWVTPTR